MKVTPKTLVYEAEQINDEFWAKYFGTKHTTGIEFAGETVLIHSLGVTMCGNRGDWVITRETGERFPLRAEVFAAIYDGVIVQRTEAGKAGTRSRGTRSRPDSLWFCPRCRLVYAIPNPYLSLGPYCTAEGCTGITLRPVDLEGAE